MNVLYLEDLEGLSENDIVEHLIIGYEAKREEIEKYNILIAYESVGSWGCDSSSFFLLQDKETKKLYEVHGSHCSCYGFEDQFKPEEATLEYLKSDHFSFYTGGYDDNEDKNRMQIKNYINTIEQ